LKLEKFELPTRGTVSLLYTYSHKMPGSGLDSREPLLKNKQPSQTRFKMGKKMEQQKRKKVLVVGAGAAGESRDSMPGVRRAYY